MRRTDLIEHQKLNKDVWKVPSDEETEKSRLLNALERENKLLLLAIGAIIAIFGVLVLIGGGI
jgi:hypothetical protein|tara:strand:- start:403 stop:591 length:189 start_codon:yes stop_codon:yes gene_type:complete